jgi:hypothetical protein
LRQALRRRQHFDVIDAEFGDRIDNGVADRSERRRSAALAAECMPRRFNGAGTSLSAVFSARKGSARGIA